MSVPCLRQSDDAVSIHIEHRGARWRGKMFQCRRCDDRQHVNRFAQELEARGEYADDRMGDVPSIRRVRSTTLGSELKWLSQ